MRTPPVQSVPPPAAIRSCLAHWSAVLCLAGCASRPQPVQTSMRVPATNQTVSAEAVQSINGQIIYVHNYSTQAIRVTSVTLYDCQHIRTPCTLYPLNILVEPGQQRHVLDVEGQEDSEWSYHYHWSWAAVQAGR